LNLKIKNENFNTNLDAMQKEYNIQIVALNSEIGLKDQEKDCLQKELN
jgi:hypothetical protein